jgi:hypothetical protein
MKSNGKSLEKRVGGKKLAILNGGSLNYDPFYSEEKKALLFCS